MVMNEKQEGFAALIGDQGRGLEGLYLLENYYNRFDMLNSCLSHLCDLTSW